MKEIFLVSPDTVKTYSNLNDNTWEKYLLPAIREAQSIELRTTLGVDLYHQLLDMVEDGTITASTNTVYKAMLDDYIQPFLVYQTLVNLIPIMATKLANIGTVISNDEHLTNLSQPERELVQRHYTSRAAHYRMLLVEFLKNNFPDECGKNRSWDYCTIWLGGEVGCR